MAESIAECLSVRREKLCQQLIQSSCAISHDHLVDFDLQVKVIILCVLLEYIVLVLCSIVEYQNGSA